jgi:hypothetical protein
VDDPAAAQDRRMTQPDPADGPARGHLRRRAWTPVSHGLYKPTRELDGLVQDLLAWVLVLPGSAAFTGLTAAAIYGWWLPPLPDDLPVFAVIDVRDNRPRRDGLRVTRLVDPPRARLVEGVPLAPPAEVLLACARELGLLDLVVLIDAALRLGMVTLAELHEVMARRRYGVPRLRRAVALVDGRSESAWETLLRVLHVVCGVPVEPQFVLRDDEGGFVARGDLRIVGTTTLHEYDGGEHRTRHRHRSDLTRERRIGHAGWTRRGYTSVEVLHQAVAILRDADRSLGRRHRPERVRAWHALLADSLFTSRGTELVRRRWGLPVRVDGHHRPLQQPQDCSS